MKAYTHMSNINVMKYNVVMLTVAGFYEINTHVENENHIYSHAIPEWCNLEHIQET